MTDLVILENDHKRVSEILDRLHQDCNAKLTLLLDKNGQQIASTGDLEGIDPTALASLAAGNVAATDGLAELVGEKEFSILFHEGQRDNLHINVVAGSAILVVRFDEKSSLGLVRLRVNQIMSDLAPVIEEIMGRPAAEAAAGERRPSPLKDITEDDVDALLG